MSYRIPENAATNDILEGLSRADVNNELDHIDKEAYAGLAGCIGNYLKEIENVTGRVYDVNIGFRRIKPTTQ